MGKIRWSCSIASKRQIEILCCYNILQIFLFDVFLPCSRKSLSKKKNVNKKALNVRTIGLYYTFIFENKHCRKQRLTNILFFEIDTDIWSQISVAYYRASFIIVKFKFAYRPIFKRSNIGRSLVGSYHCHFDWSRLRICAIHPRIFVSRITVRVETSWGVYSLGWGLHLEFITSEAGGLSFYHPGNIPAVSKFAWIGYWISRDRHGEALNLIPRAGVRIR